MTLSCLPWLAATSLIGLAGCTTQLKVMDMDNPETKVVAEYSNINDGAKSISVGGLIAKKKYYRKEVRNGFVSASNDFSFSGGLMSVAVNEVGVKGQ